MKLILFIIAPVALSFCCLLARVIYNRMEIRRLERNGYRKLSARFKASNRGAINFEILRGLAELLLLLLLLAAVLGWLSHSDPW